MFHDRIAERVRKLGLSQAAFAAVANISAPKLSRFFHGREELAPGKALELDQLLQDIVTLQQCFPVPIEMHDAKWLKLAVKRFREGKFEKFRDVTKEFAKDELDRVAVQWYQDLDDFAKTEIEVV